MARRISKLSYSVLFMFYRASELFWNWVCRHTPLAFYVSNLSSVPEIETAPFALLLPSVLSTAQYFANSPIRCQNAATRHQLSVCLPRVSTGLVGCSCVTAVPASFTLMCNVHVETEDKSLWRKKEVSSGVFCFSFRLTF